MLAAFKIHDMTATRGEAVIKCGGVAAFAVSPEYRGAGIGQDLMLWAMKRKRDENLPLASLYAFKESYYRKLGWEVAGWRYRITCPNARLPKNRCELPVNRLKQSDWLRLQPAYKQFAMRYSGMNIRD